MASTDALPLSPLVHTDIAGCMALSAEAGWNQNPDDWAAFLRHGTVFGLRHEDGHPVATGAIVPYGEAFAWISMVLVTAQRRRERIGTRILEKCCTELAGRGLVAVLDATPAGERVYRPLGFEPMFGLARWQGEGQGGEGGGGRDRSAPAVGVRAMTAADMPAVSAIDAASFGACRAFLLENFFGRAPHVALVTNDGDGFVLARPGRIATQIGPIVAPDQDTAGVLIAAALQCVAGPVFLDLADRWTDLKRALERWNFTVQRPYLRMGLHRAAAFGRPEHLFVIAGPEFG
jgi:GNAT superfamily N-acetyltransferase